MDLQDFRFLSSCITWLKVNVNILKMKFAVKCMSPKVLCCEWRAGLN